MMSGALSAFGWRRHNRFRLADRCVVVLGLALTWWTGVVLVARSIGGPDAWPQMACSVLPTVLPAITLVPPALVLLTRNMIEPAWRPSPLLYAALAIEPVVMTAVGVTNGWHHQLLTCEPGSAAFGPAFWIHTSYCYVLIGIAFATVARELVAQTPSRLMAVNGLAIAIAIAGNVLTLSGDLSGPDWTPIFLGVGLTVACVLIYRGRLLDIEPLSRIESLELLREGVLVIDEGGGCVHANPSARALLMARTPQPSLTPQPSETPEPSLTWKAAAPPTTLSPGVVDQFVALASASQGPVTWAGRQIDVGVTPVLNGSRPVGRILILTDVTDEHRTRAELAAANDALRVRLEEIETLRADLAERVVRDPLTGLYNRAFLDQLPAEGVGRVVALLDIDSFKQINDERGHQVGDEVLIRVAAALRGAFVDEAKVVRLGGDEMLVVTDSLGVDQVCAGLDAARSAIAAEVHRALGIDRAVTVSVGVASRRHQPVALGMLVASADVALYEAKRRGRNRVHRVDLQATDLAAVEPLAQGAGVARR